MKLSIHKNILITPVQPILGLAAAASLVGIGYFGTQAFGRTPMLMIGGAMSTIGLAAQLAQSLVPKLNPQPQLVVVEGEEVEAEEEEEEEVVPPPTKKRGKQAV